MEKYVFAFLIVVCATLNAFAYGYHPCERDCREGEKPKTCVYNFTIEWYITLSKACYECPFNVSDCFRPECVSGDGQRRKIITVNREYPGPKIQVCENDTVIVNVHNELENGEGTIIHWHGMTMTGNVHMDGGGRITQCPIPAGNTFRYKFKAYPAGTFIYHSHFGRQRADGLSGALIVQKPRRLNPHYSLYDHDCDTPSGDCDYTTFISEWVERDFLRFEMEAYHYSPTQTRRLKQSALINGRGQHYNASNVLHPDEVVQTPLHVYNVEAGKRYRLRVVGFGVNCWYQLSVDNHKLLVISADGYDVEPLEVDVVNMQPGERYDVIFEADQDVDNYWMKAYSSGCGNAHAIVRYNGAPDVDPTGDRNSPRFGDILNEPYPLSSDGFHNTMAIELNSTKNEDFTGEQVDEVHFIGMDFLLNDHHKWFDDEHYPSDEIAPQFLIRAPVLNNISFLSPPSPLVTQYRDVDPNTICNSSTIDHEACVERRCNCAHVEKLGLHKVVDLVFINLGGVIRVGHPMHLHGYHFRAVAQGELGDITSVDQVKKLYYKGEMNFKTVNPTYRDTVQVPAAGYMVARIYTDNPGFWLVHCHIDVHADIGQMMVLQVGEIDDMPRVPRDMPKCGDYLPPVHDDDSDDWSHDHDTESHDQDSWSREHHEDSNLNILNHERSENQNDGAEASKLQKNSHIKPSFIKHFRELRKNVKKSR